MELKTLLININFSHSFQNAPGIITTSVILCYISTQDQVSYSFF